MYLASCFGQEIPWEPLDLHRVKLPTTDRGCFSLFNVNSNTKHQAVLFHSTQLGIEPYTLYILPYIIEPYIDIHIYHNHIYMGIEPYILPSQRQSFFSLPTDRLIVLLVEEGTAKHWGFHEA